MNKKKETKIKKVKNIIFLVILKVGLKLKRLRKQIRRCIAGQTLLKMCKYRMILVNEFRKTFAYKLCHVYLWFKEERTLLAIISNINIFNLSIIFGKKDVHETEN